MKRKILGSAAALGVGAVMLLGLAGPAHASGGDCDDVGNGNYIQYSWADSDHYFTFQCVNGFWVFVDGA
jgi:hypothetical protein